MFEKNVDFIYDALNIYLLSFLLSCSAAVIRHFSGSLLSNLALSCVCLCFVVDIY